MTVASTSGSGSGSWLFPRSQRIATHFGRGFNHGTLAALTCEEVPVAHHILVTFSLSASTNWPRYCSPTADPDSRRQIPPFEIRLRSISPCRGVVYLMPVQRSTFTSRTQWPGAGDVIPGTGGGGGSIQSMGGGVYEDTHHSSLHISIH